MSMLHKSGEKKFASHDRGVNYAKQFVRVEIVKAHPSHGHHDHGQVAHKSIQTPKKRKNIAGITSYGMTSEKIRGHREHHRSVHDAEYPSVNPEYPEDNFAEKYGFKHSHSPRSPVSRWEHERIVRDAEIHGKEHRFVGGTPDHWGHGPKQRMGHLRLSGHHGAHQVGKRTK
jgi:hypothetical protein